MSSFDPVFQRLKKLLSKYAEGFTINPDTSTSYGLQGKPGIAAVKAWGGEMRKPVMPVAWIETGKSYVSYHLMGLYMNPEMLAGMSKELKARMQGKTCFNFKNIDEIVLQELEELTERSIRGFKKAGFVV